MLDAHILAKKNKELFIFLAYISLFCVNVKLTKTSSIYFYNLTHEL